MIFNPASNGGRGARRIPRYLELLRRHLPSFQYRTTSRSGEEGPLAEEAIRRGFRVLAVAGGDGTWSTVADRILCMAPREAALGILPAGTGNDFGRNLGLPGGDLELAVRALAEGSFVQVDAGQIVTGCRHEEREASPRSGRYFLNVVGFGFDVAVVDRSKSARFLRGALLYKATAFGQLFRYRGFQSVLEDGRAFRLEDHTLMLTLTNGRNFGGGFAVAPEARLQDGLLHACHIRNVGPVGRLSLFQKVARGRHSGNPHVTLRASRRFRVTVQGRARFEIDGDLYEAPEGVVEAAILPRGLRVVAPPRRT